MDDLTKDKLDILHMELCKLTDKNNELITKYNNLKEEKENFSRTKKENKSRIDSTYYTVLILMIVAELILGGNLAFLIAIIGLPANIFVRIYRLTKDELHMSNLEEKIKIVSNVRNTTYDKLNEIRSLYFELKREYDNRVINETSKKSLVVEEQPVIEDVKKLTVRLK